VISAADDDDDDDDDDANNSAAAAPGYVAVIVPVEVPAAYGKRWKSPHVVAYSTC